MKKLKIYKWSALLMVLLCAAQLVSAQSDQPVFKLDKTQQVNESRMLRYVVLSGYRDGVKPIRGSMGMNFDILNDPQSGTRRVVMYNLSIVEMLSHFPVDPATVVLEVKDLSRYMYLPEYGDQEAWMRKNAYCYEYLAPAKAIVARVGTGPSAAFKWDLELRDRLGVTLRYEKRPDASGTPVDFLILTEKNYKKP